MSILDNLKGIFSKEKGLRDLGMDELLQTRVQLEREQQRVLRKIDEIEKQKAALDSQGRAERSKLKKTLLAEQMLQYASQTKHLSGTLAYFSKQLRITDGLIFLKENEQLLFNTRLGEFISRMKMEDLQDYVDREMLRGSFVQGRLTKLVQVFEDGGDLLEPDEEDPRVTEILALWEEAEESEATMPSLEETLLDLEEAEGEV